jgi:hypothetical protein
MTPALRAAMLLISMLAISGARAATYQFETPVGSTHGKAVFDMSTNQVIVTLTNLVVDPTSVGSVLVSVNFTLEGGPFTGGSLVSSSATPRTVAKKTGTYTDGPAGPTDWVYSRSLSTILLSWNNGSGPDQGIIGPPNNSTNKYNNANGSIGGNGPHNPFLGLSGTFTVGLTGVTPLTTVSNVKIGWNTSPSDTGQQVTALCTTPGGCATIAVVVPEPGFLLPIGAGLIALAAFAKRRK